MDFFTRKTLKSQNYAPLKSKIMVDKVYSDDAYVKLMPCINPSGFFDLTIRDNEQGNFHEIVIQLNESDLSVLIQDLKDKLAVLKVLNHSN